MHLQEKSVLLALRRFGVQYVIIGHSERREMFNETDETVNKKALLHLNMNLTPIVCVVKHWSSVKVAIRKNL